MFADGDPMGLGAPAVAGTLGLGSGGAVAASTPGARGVAGVGDEEDAVLVVAG